MAWILGIWVLAATILMPTTGLAQNGWEDRALRVFDDEGSLVTQLGEPGRYWGVAISPDGSRVAVIKPYEDGVWYNGDLWVFDVAGRRSVRIAIAESGDTILEPVWSSDGTEVAYATRRNGVPGVYRNAADGKGAEELLFVIENSLWPIRVVDWSRDGRYVLFLNGGHLYVHSVHGQSKPEMLVSRSESVQLGLARLSPDGRLIAYPSAESGTAQVWVRSVALGEGSDTDVPRKWQVSEDGVFKMISWNDDGSALYYLNDGLEIMKADVDSREDLRFGSPRRLLSAPDGAPEATLSRDGARLIVPVPLLSGLQQISLLDRRGRLVKEVGPPGLYSAPSLSPDGRRIAVLRDDLRTRAVDVWTFDVETGEGRQVTSDRAAEGPPVWSPDGRVTYVAARGDYAGVYRWDGTGEAELLYRHTPGATLQVSGFSPDGRFLSINSGGVVYVVDLTTEEDPLHRKAVPFVQEAFQAGGSRFSPDSRFLGFRSKASGQWEVYIQAFDDASGTPVGQPVQVSRKGTRGGIAWGRNGRELYFLDRDEKSPGLMAVEVSTSPELQTSAPSLLFRQALWLDTGQQTASADGERFVFIQPSTSGAQTGSAGK